VFASFFAAATLSVKNLSRKNIHDDKFLLFEKFTSVLEFESKATGDESMP